MLALPSLVFFPTHVSWIILVNHRFSTWLSSSTSVAFLYTNKVEFNVEVDYDNLASSTRFCHFFFCFPDKLLPLFHVYFSTVDYKVNSARHCSVTGNWAEGVHALLQGNTKIYINLNCCSLTKYTSQARLYNGRLVGLPVMLGIYVHTTWVWEWDSRILKDHVCNNVKQVKTN